MDEESIARAYFDQEARKFQREQAARDAEPRDPAWAPAMEVQLQQFIARHPLGDRFVVTSIDCRSMYCEVKAEGNVVPGQKHEDSANGAFQIVTKEIIEQLDLRPGANGGGSDGARAHMYHRFRRFGLGECPPGYPQDCHSR